MEIDFQRLTWLLWLMANNFPSNESSFTKDFETIERSERERQWSHLCVNKSIVLVDHAKTLRKVNQDTGVVKLHVNISHFSTTARQVTHLHVERPLIKSNLSIEILHEYQTLFKYRETEKTFSNMIRLNSDINQSINQFYSPFLHIQ